MNILLMPSWYPDYNQTGNSDGNLIHGIFITDQVRLLTENRAKVTVFLPKMAGFLRFDKIRLSVRKKEGFKEVAFTFPKLFPVIKSGYYISFNIICIIGYILIRFFVIRKKINLIHSHILFLSGYSSYVLKKIFRVPCILTEHTGPFRINNKLEFRLASKTFRNIDALIGVSRSLLNNIENYNFIIKKKYIVGNAVDTDYFVPGITLTGSGAGHIFLNVSTFYEYKGIEYLLKAVKLLKDKGLTDFEVRIAGDGPDKQNLLKMTEENQLSGYVKFLGMLPRDSVREEFHRAGTLVFPSLMETFGLVVAEAMSCGLPVIATVNGGSENIVSEGTGILIEPRNEAMLASVMEKRINNEMNFDRDFIRQHIIQNWGFKAIMEKYRMIWNELNITSENDK